jgi:hypothetical protein
MSIDDQKSRKMALEMNDDRVLRVIRNVCARVRDVQRHVTVQHRRNKTKVRKVEIQEAISCQL